MYVRAVRLNSLLEFNCQTGQVSKWCLQGNGSLCTRFLHCVEVLHSYKPSRRAVISLQI